MTLTLKDQSQISSILSVVCCPVPNVFVLCTSLILFEGYMHQDVAEGSIPRQGHCDLELNCQGQIIVIISSIGQSYFVLRHSAFIFCMFMHYDMTVWCI